jgi:hypothetical protein
MNYLSRYKESRGSSSLSVLSPELKWQRREVEHSHPSSAKIKNGVAIPPLPHTSSCLIISLQITGMILNLSSLFQCLLAPRSSFCSGLRWQLSRYVGGRAFLFSIFRALGVILTQYAVRALQASLAGFCRPTNLVTITSLLRGIKIVIKFINLK